MPLSLCGFQAPTLRSAHSPRLAGGKQAPGANTVLRFTAKFERTLENTTTLPLHGSGSSEAAWPDAATTTGGGFADGGGGGRPLGSQPDSQGRGCVTNYPTPVASPSQE